MVKVLIGPKVGCQVWICLECVKKGIGRLKVEVTYVIREKRMRFAGHCWRSKDELASDTILWIPKHGKTKVGRPAKTYVDQLMNDSGLSVETLPHAMSKNRLGWRKRVNEEVKGKQVKVAS